MFPLALMLLSCAKPVSVATAPTSPESALSAPPSASTEDAHNAVMAYESAFDACPPAPPWPRPESQLSATPAPWSVEPHWALYGWDPGQPVLATFEVVGPDTACTVRASVDADGDGVPARWHMTGNQDHEPVLDTPEGVR